MQASQCALSFVKEEAKEEFFFDTYLTFTPSKRACLVKSRTTFIPQKSSLNASKPVRTLFNFDEPIIDIKAGWFSKMRNLTMLHLGLLGRVEKHEAIFKFPPFVSSPNLRTLNIRDCSYLEELPAGIGSLKQLTHLDLTHCHMLSKLPKWMRLLSKLAQRLCDQLPDWWPLT
ncbi:hypothetical protein V2J09_000264 [Rumex salicifolius]